MKPLHYANYIIQYKGEGSLFKYLEGKGYITSISTELSESNREFGIFKLTLHITPKALMNLEDLVPAVYGYLEEMRDLPLNEDIIKELKQISHTKFIWADNKEEPGKYANRLSNNLIDYEAVDVIRGDYEMTDTEYYQYNVRDILMNFSIENSFCVLSTRVDFPIDVKEKFFPKSEKSVEKK